MTAPKNWALLLVQQNFFVTDKALNPTVNPLGACQLSRLVETLAKDHREGGKNHRPVDPFRGPATGGLSELLRERVIHG
jgi:hypothetical protein